MFDYTRGVSAFWKYAAASGGITTSGDVAIKASVATRSNQLSRISLHNVHATVATELEIKRGSTVVQRYYLPAMMPAPMEIVFDPPLSTTGGQAFNVNCVTTGAQVYVNAQGWEGGWEACL